jgi:outer membrane protein assembly factor BamB
MSSIRLLAVGLFAAIGTLVAPLGHRVPNAASRDVAPATGIASPLWHIAGEAWGTPAVDAPSSTVYFLTKTHEVVALEAGTGAERWRARTGEGGSTTAGSLVLLAGDEVVAGDYNVVAFDRRDGALRWRFTPTDGYGAGIYLGAAAGDLVLAGSPAGRVYAIDRRTGTARWSHLVIDDGKTTIFQPVTDGEIVVAGYTTFTAPNTGGMVALDIATGRERWRVAFPRPADPTLDSGWAGGPLLTDEAVIGVSAEGVVFGFDRRDGTVRWTLPKWSGSRPAPPRDLVARDRDFRPLTRSGRQLFVGSLSGEVTAYDLDDRAERWRYSSERNGSIAFRMTSDERSIYVPYVDGCLVALDRADGRERWRTSDRFAGFTWPPAVSGDRVYAADFVAGFFAFPK